MIWLMPLSMFLWFLVIWGGSCAYNAAIAQEMPVDSLDAYDVFFSKTNKWICICDSAYIEDGVAYFHVRWLFSTGDPDSIKVETDIWQVPVEGEDGEQKFKRYNPLRL